MAVRVRRANGQRAARPPDGGLQSMIGRIRHVLQREDLSKTRIGSQSVHVRRGRFALQTVRTSAGSNQTGVGRGLRSNLSSVEQQEAAWNSGLGSNETPAITARACYQGLRNQRFMFAERIGC